MGVQGGAWWARQQAPGSGTLLGSPGAHCFVPSDQLQFNVEVQGRRIRILRGTTPFNPPSPTRMVSVFISGPFNAIDLPGAYGSDPLMLKHNREYR
jgi:hypothetical protein